MKNNKKEAGIATLISAGCFVLFILLGTFTDPATYCEHEYYLVDSKAASCVDDGFEMYHCDLCDRDNQIELTKLGHEMVDVRRIEPD